LAVDSAAVYWFNLGTNNSQGKTFGGWTNGQVMKCSIGGCENSPILLASGRNQATFDTPLAFGVDGTDVFWSDTTPTANGVGIAGLLKCSVVGCNGAPAIVGINFARELAIGGDRLYWTEFDADVLTCPSAGCASSPVSLWAAGAVPESVGIAVDATNVYWSTTAGEIMACAVGGCKGTPSVLMTADANIPAVGQLALDADNVYFTDANPDGLGQILACAKSGCGNHPALIANGLSAPLGIVTDGIDIYWTEAGQTVSNGMAVGGAGSVRRCGVAGCQNTPTTVASGLDYPTAVAVDAQNVYWSEAGAGAASGRIWVSPK
jgi:hypothetical protein